MNMGGLYGEGYALTPGPQLELWQYSDLFGPRPRTRKVLTREQKKRRREIKQQAKRLRKLRR